jgi:hypothetical protein
MTEPNGELLTDILGQVLQDSAYIFAEPDEEPAGWEGSVIVARIAFESTRGGSLRLVTTPEAASEIAANMLGIDAGEEADANGRSAVAELLNVVGGAFLVRYFGTAVPSQLGLPSTECCTGPAPGPRCCVATVRTEAGAPLLLELDLEARV